MAQRPDANNTAPMTLSEDALHYHRFHRGKIGIYTKAPLRTREDLSLAYTPGVAAPCREIAANPACVWEYTNRRNTVAVVTDGSAVLGLGNIGPEAALPVMEGKAALFREFGGIDAIPICLATQDTEEIIRAVEMLEPTFGGINLEDIAAPRCFAIEERLRASLKIPVFHDDQHGTAIVVLAGLLNALRLTGRTLERSTIVVNGAGAAGIAITRFLLASGATSITLVDSHGIVTPARTDLNPVKVEMCKTTNPGRRSGSLMDAMRGADIIIGVSKAGLITGEMIRAMAPKPIVFALANPDPEILPDAALAAGASIVATGRSDFPNQVNNLLAFPGIFRGTLDAEAQSISPAMELAAAHALASYVTHPDEHHILPDPLDRNVAKAVAEAVRKAV